MSATLTNGKPQRKQLSDQLDRLDGILDVLAEALPGAVADAVRDGARQAVEDAVLELLANPDLRALLARPPAEPTPPAPPAPSRWARLKAKLRHLRARTGIAIRPAAEVVVAKCRTALPAVAAAASAAGLVWRFRRAGAAAAGVGVAVGMASYLAPHPVSAMVGGVGGAVAALAVRAGLWARAAARKLGIL